MQKLARLYRVILDILFPGEGGDIDPVALIQVLREVERCR